jgi:hypothetical protein
MVDIANFKNHVDRFLNEHRSYQKWIIEYVGISVRLREDDRVVLARNDILPQNVGRSGGRADLMCVA